MASPPIFAREFPTPDSRALLMVVGSVLFLVAAFMPVTVVFVFGDLEQVRSNSAAWVIANGLFITGTVVSLLGLGLFVLRLGRPASGPLAWVALGAFALAALCWTAICYYRVALPLEQVGAEPNLGLMFVAYTVLSEAGFAVLGATLVIDSAYRSWIGWGIVAVAVALLATYAIAKDMPPLVHSLLTLVLGATVLLSPNAVASASARASSG